MLRPVFDFLDGPVRQLVTELYETVGYLGVALWVAIESVIIPIPSELILPFAGFLVGEGVALEPITGQPWSLWLVVLAGTLGATTGGLIAYAIGYWGGRPVILRWGRWLGITAADIDRTEAFFARYGAAASLIGRMIPVVRSLVSFGAGVGRMPLVPFMVFTVLGSIPWNLALVLAGYMLGERWAQFEVLMAQYEYLVLGGIGLAGLAWIWLRVVRPRLQAADSESQP